MLQFEWPWLALAVLAPFAVARLVRAAAPSGGALRAPFFAAVRSNEQNAPKVPDWRGLALGTAAWIALVTAACRPQWIEEPVGIPVTGRSLLLALDVSASMRSANLGSEMAISVVRRVAANFIARREGDRVGLILFGTRPYLQAPLTFDRNAVRQMVGEAVVGIAGDDTAIGDAIGLGIRSTRALDAAERVLILLTDGTNTGGTMTPDDAARMARANGLRVYTIGVGARARGPSEETLDEETLVEVARVTGAEYFRAEDAAALEAIYRTLDELEPMAEGKQRFLPTREVFHWPLAIALVLGLGTPVVGLGQAR